VPTLRGIGWRLFTHVFNGLFQLQESPARLDFENFIGNPTVSESNLVNKIYCEDSKKENRSSSAGPKYPALLAS